MCACLFVLIVFFFCVCVCMHVIQVDIQQYTTTDGPSRSVNTHVQILNQSGRFSLHSQKLLRVWLAYFDQHAHAQIT